MSSAADPAAGVRKTPRLLTWPAAVFGPLLSAIGATVVPLSITEAEGLDAWIRWITDDLYFRVGIGCLLAGLLWASLGAIWPKREADKLREELAAKATAHETALATKVSEARVRASEGIVHQLSPVVHALGNLVDSKQTNHGGTLIDRCLNAVTQIIDVTDVRACLYYLDQVESDEASSTDILNALNVRLPQVGRNDVPRSSFIRGKGAHADGIFEVVDSGTSRLIPDVDADNSGVDCAEKRYKTFLNVSVKFKTEEIGILSVDAPTAGALTNNHLLLAEMVANIIAIGMWREKRRNSGRNPSPESVIGNAPVNPAAGDNA